MRSAVCVARVPPGPPPPQGGALSGPCGFLERAIHVPQRLAHSQDARPRALDQSLQFEAVLQGQHELAGGRGRRRRITGSLGNGDSPMIWRTGER